MSETDAPEGFQPAANQNVTIESNATAELTFTHEAAPKETGTVALQLKDQDGNPADGACVQLSSEENNISGQQYCDNGAGDQNPDPAMLEVTNLPVGSYSAQPVPQGETGPQAAAAAAAHVRPEHLHGQGERDDPGRRDHHHPIARSR